jgi:hypothetical protein
MMVLEKGNPESMLNLAAEIETGFDELGCLPARLERYGIARHRAVINLAQVTKRIKEFEEKPENAFEGDGWGRSFNPFIRHLQNLQPRVDACGNYLGFRHYYTVGRVRLTAARFCKCHLLCPLCAIRRGSKMLTAYVEKHALILAENPGLKMSMITFTVKNGDDLQERYKHLKKSIQNLEERRRNYLRKGTGKTEFSKVLGFFGTYEVTNHGKGWHPHVHMLVLHREFIKAAPLKREWAEITGDSHVLRIDPCRHPNDPGQDFLEVCKYALKFSDLDPEQNLHAYEVLRGQRLVFSAGLFWGVDIPEELTDSPLEELPYFEMLYKFILGSGYNLTTKAKLYGVKV